jgi:ribosomal-protein-alanine N-acetyltransferase
VSGAVHLTGSKVRLDSFAGTDLTPAYVGWLNDPQVVRFSNQRFQTHSTESCRAYLASFEGSANLFLSVKTLDGRAIGTMSVYRSVPHGTADVGIMIGERSCWGGGYGQDAWDTLLGWLLVQPGLRKVTAGALACNVGMVRLMERSGMTLEGVRRGQELVEGSPQDIVLYARFAP